jgi:HD-GYP domain-containing protein (c-di-GMP phosphodiesterase class II)
MSDPELEAVGHDFVVQLVRTLRVAQVHDLSNEAARQVQAALLTALRAAMGHHDTVAVQVMGEAVYFNGEFLRARGAVFEAAAQARQLFERLGLSELRITGVLEPAELHAVLVAVQEALHAQDPQRFATRTFPRVALRPATEEKKVDVDARVALARAYAQLVVTVEEVEALVAHGKGLPLARLRRAVHEVLRASEGRRVLLAGLLRLDATATPVTLHASASSALTALMASELGLARREVVHLALVALLVGLAAKVGVSALASAMARVEITPRVTAMLEVEALLAGRDVGVEPGMDVRLVALAIAHDRAVRPLDGARPERADQAIARVLAEAEQGRQDPRLARLLVRVVGLFPVGSWVRLSGGQLAIVVGLPDDGASASRPIVRVVEERGAPASYVVELARRPELSITEGVEPRAARLNVVPFLLA